LSGLVESPTDQPEVDHIAADIRSFVVQP
jgi:hypothetical protein